MTERLPRWTADDQKTLIELRLLMGQVLEKLDRLPREFNDGLKALEVRVTALEVAHQRQIGAMWAGRVLLVIAGAIAGWLGKGQA